MMETETRLECLRLAVEASNKVTAQTSIVQLAQQFYEWVSENNKDKNKLVMEKSERS